MATRSSYFLAVLLIANPFMILVFQNCTASHSDRDIASIESSETQQKGVEPEFSIKVDRNLIIQ